MGVLSRKYDLDRLPRQSKSAAWSGYLSTFDALHVLGCARHVPFRHKQAKQRGRGKRPHPNPACEGTPLRKKRAAVPLDDLTCKYSSACAMKNYLMLCFRLELRYTGTTGSRTDFAREKDGVTHRFWMIEWKGANDHEDDQNTKRTGGDRPVFAGD